MTLEQKEKIAAVIRADAEVRGQLVNDEGQTCVVGGLLRAAGWSDEDMRSLSHDVYRCLFDDYGLDLVAVSRLVQVNDAYFVVDARRDALLMCLDSIRV